MSCCSSILILKKKTCSELDTPRLISKLKHFSSQIGTKIVQFGPNSIQHDLESAQFEAKMI